MRKAPVASNSKSSGSNGDESSTRVSSSKASLHSDLEHASKALARSVTEFRSPVTNSRLRPLRATASFHEAPESGTASGSIAGECTWVPASTSARD